MDNQEQEEKRLQGRPTKPDEELAWRRKSTPPVSHLLGKKQIPKRFQAILCLMQDDRSATGRVLTREHLDEMPSTKALPKQEKDLLYGYWPHWQTDVAQMTAIALLRKEQADLAAKSLKVAEIIERREGFDNLSLHEQMKITAKVLDKQFQHAALIVASTSAEDISEENAKLAVDLFKTRVMYLKDVHWIREKIWDLSERLEQKAREDFLNGQDDDELQAILLSADEVIQRKASR